MHCRTGMLFLTLVALSAFGAEYDRSTALDISQGAIGRQLDNYTLRDSQGQPFVMSELRGKPLVVSMIYTSCHHVCPTITRNLRDKIEVAQEALGEDAFNVVTVGFDWRVDTPDRMREFESRLGVDRVPNWRFLAIEAGVVDKLSDNLGFLFYPSAKGFDHLTQTTIVGADGRIYRQVYGVDVETTAIVEPLKELVFNTPREAGFVEHWVSTFKLFCTVYDPNTNRYRFDYSIFMAIIVGVFSLGLIGVFIAKEWPRAR